MKKTKLSDFVLHGSGRVWVTDSGLNFPYSDGEAVETHILNIVRQAKNVDVFSQELIAEIRDWPTEYHFSPRRANIIRILTDIGPETRVLELGCGCGAITKALAETGCQVDAIEGSFRRAAVAAERVRDHANARVHVSNFQDVEFSPIYDVVTLIGVLEYAPVYLDAIDPFVACLEMARSALKPDGVLVVAIENKLGLKYLAGISEDHFCVPYYGVEGRYDRSEITTYGKKQLLARFSRAGFAAIDCYYPFPDYKLPEVVLSDRALHHSDFNIADLVSGLENRDYSGVGKANFRLDLACESAADEGLLGDLANSFLFVAHHGEDCPLLDSSILAYKFSDNREPAFNTVTRFFVREDELFSKKKALLPQATIIKTHVKHILAEEKYISGRNLLNCLRKAISFHKIDDFSNLLSNWATFIETNATEGKLEGAWLDAIPSNCIIDANGSLNYIDREWLSTEQVLADVVVCRGIISLCYDPIISDFFGEDDLINRFKKIVKHIPFTIPQECINSSLEINNYLWEHVYSCSRWDAGKYRFRQEKATPFPIRAIAFYLPQFHAIPENDAWWGTGFTEWTNVKQGRPLFDGHYQPHEPAELGYYDLSDVSVLDKQAQLARQYGLEGFCFYYYWFDGKRLLEKPVDQLLAHPEIDLPFCLCWANENWTRRWDGGDQEILIKQNYTTENNTKFALDFLPYLRDTRYIKVNGEPLILIYRPDLIPDIKHAARTWRQVWRDSGVGEVFIANVESFTAPDPRQIGFDASVEFPPQLMSLDRFRPDVTVTSDLDPLLNPGDYNKIADFWESRPSPTYKRFRAIVPSWDNASRRRKGNASVLIGATPERYEAWLIRTVRQTIIEFDGDERLIFVNAWNEWGEGCHLEPDLRHGRAYLEATAKAIRSAAEIDVRYERDIKPYQQWLASKQLGAKEAIRLADSLDDLVQFAVVIDATDGSAEDLARTLESFSSQQYGRFRLLVVAPQPAPVNRGQYVSWLQAETFPEIMLQELAQPSPESWFCLIKAGDQITESGLLLLATHLFGQPQVGLAYADEDELNVDYGPANPVFRPDFDLDYLRSYPYIGRHLLLRGREYLELGGLDWNAGSAKFYDYVLRFYECYGEKAISHLPTILFHASQEQKEEDAQARHAQALNTHLQRRHITAELEPGQLSGSFRVRYQHDDQPLVSIIIPTKNRLAMLQHCLESLLEKTTYKHYEILLIDNQSTDADAVNYLQGLIDLNLPNLQVLSYPHPFNFADMNNLAVQEARGEYLVLLNNDTAIVKADWLDALLNHAQRPEIGIVGAKLLYPDGKIQHGGEVLGLRGPAGRIFEGEALDAPGYFGRLLLDQQYSAVTAACMMVRKSVYESVGGMDTEAFKVSYNDVDLCLKVREAGYRVIWTPHAIVMHEGSVSQNQVDVNTQEAKQKRFEAEQQAMYRKWLPTLIADPAYNPNLSLDGEGFALETDLLFNPNSGLLLPKILAHNADSQGSGHYRVVQPLQALVAADFSGGACCDYMLDTIHLAKLAPDVVILQRQHTDVQLSHLRNYREFSRAKLIYDLDDYLPNLPLSSVHKKDFPKDILRRLHIAADLCDRVVVSTAALKATLKDLHADIVVLPNYLPTPWWGDIAPHPKPESHGKPRVGWAGGASHTGDLRLIVDVIKALADRVDWVFFGSLPDGVETSIAEFHPGVAIDDYPTRLASLNLDLALAPLENNLFNECKSNLRLLEYGICGYPVIATDIEPYRCDLPVELVKNRFKDWVNAIEEKLADRQALRAEGNALRSTVRENWMLEGANLMNWRNGWMLNDRQS